MHLAVDEHEGRVHIVAGGCLLGDRALGPRTWSSNRRAMSVWR